MTEQEKLTNYETLQHIENIRHFLTIVITAFLKRCENHDASKLKEPELSIFVEYTPKLAQSTYGSSEYKQFLDEMKPALEHHYAENRHHPEYFINGIDGMTLLDLIEMVCDWKAATLRHRDGDIQKSLCINKERFGISDQLISILRNTVEFLERQ